MIKPAVYSGDRLYFWFRYTEFPDDCVMDDFGNGVALTDAQYDQNSWFARQQA